MLIKKLMVLAFVLFGATICFAQGVDKKTADISGTWKLSKAGGERIAADSKSIYNSLTLHITANSSEIKIEKTLPKSVSQPAPEVFTFYADGRGETNAKTTLEYRSTNKSPFTTPTTYPENIESKTIWDNGKLITRYEKSTIVFYTGTVFSTAKDEWKLSADGKQLILTSSSLTESGKPSSDPNRQFGDDIQRGKIQFVFERVN